MRALWPGDEVCAGAAGQAGRLPAALLPSGGAACCALSPVLQRPAGLPGLASPYPRLYLPREGDLVLGALGERQGRGWPVDIGAALPGFLGDSSLPPGRRARGGLPAGTLVYAQVLEASPGVQPLLSCRGDGGLGPVEGALVRLPLDACASLLEDRAPLLELSRSLPCELALGVNGMVGVRAATPYDTITVGLCLRDLPRMQQVLRERRELFERARKRARSD